MLTTHTHTHLLLHPPKKQLVFGKDRCQSCTLSSLLPHSLFMCVLLLLLVGWWCVLVVAVVVFGGRGVHNSHFPLNLWFFSFACVVKLKLTKWQAKKAIMNVEALFFLFFYVGKHIIVEHLFKNIHPSLPYSSRCDKECEASDSYCPGDQPG